MREVRMHRRTEGHWGYYYIQCWGREGMKGQEKAVPEHAAGEQLAS